VASSGGTVKRYEVHPDPQRLKQYGITLAQLQTAITNNNANVGGDYLFQGPNVLNVRGLGLLGGGLDAMTSKEVLGAEKTELDNYLSAASQLSDAEKTRLKIAYLGTNGKNTAKLTAAEEDKLREMRRVVATKAALRASAYLRAKEQLRLKEIGEIVIASVNSVPFCVQNVVEGGPGYEGENNQGVIVGHQTRLGQVSFSKPKLDAKGDEVRGKDGHAVWDDENEKVQGVVLLRKDEQSLPALRDVEEKVAELNKPGRLPPGIKIEPFYDRTDLIKITTETVRENLALGMLLVTVILLMFLSNIRSALIVALNIPLALLFAFSVLFLRGKSANLLSIGAVDFGIIVDSSVIIVENIYRHISSGENPNMPLKNRIISASHEVERALFFSTAVMVCAFIPLFTMQGPEGQIFGPMADTYAFALGGALLLALTLSPVLCRIFFRNLKPAPDNYLVRRLKEGYLRQLDRCLRHRGLTMAVFGVLIVITIALLPLLGREFMPELEEGNLWIRGTFPLNISLDEVDGKVQVAQAIMQKYPEVESICAQIGRPDDGTDPTGFYNVEFFVPLKAQKLWPKEKAADGWMKFLRSKRARSKSELVQELNDELANKLVGVDWNFSQNIRDNVMESLSGIKGDNSIKILGPDLARLEELADQVKNRMDKIRGIQNVGVFHIMGQPDLEFPVDRQKCKRWGTSVADVDNVIQSAVGGKSFSSMIEGEKTFDIALRWPERLRASKDAILDIPVDVTNNTVAGSAVPGVPSTPTTGGSSGIALHGTSRDMPTLAGNIFNGTANNISNAPRVPLRNLVTPVNDKGEPDPKADFVRAGASTIYREQGNRLIAVKFSVRGRDLASAVAEAQRETEKLIEAPYQAQWSGEFQEMEDAERRLMIIIPLSLGMIFVLLYLAFGSLLDVMAILSNVVALSMGGIWALLLTGTNFSISAAVGFISIFGVAIMDGLLLIAYFNQMRAQGLPLDEAILQGAEKRVRPIMMTALTAVLGLLPAALSTRIGAQTQRPLAIVVVGGMITTLLLTRYLMPVLYSFYGHREPKAHSGIAH
jgi:cobalt-zinc-cadmium resistance protein CzcA